MAIRLSKSAGRALLGSGKRHKYNARRTVVDGITFDSAKEARRYGELKLLQDAGKISGLTVQPRYPLTVYGVKIGEYRGDFRYCDTARNPILVIEDVKSPATRTALWKWKIKHLRAEYGIEVVEV